MTRTGKNILTAGVFLLSLLMIILTVASLTGRTADARPGVPGEGISDGGGTGDRPDFSPAEGGEGEEIGEIPGDGISGDFAPDGDITNPAPAPGDQKEDRSQMTRRVALLPYLIFGGLWLFVLAFTVAWAILTRMNAYALPARSAGKEENHGTSDQIQTI